MALVVSDFANKIRDELATEFGSPADDSSHNMKFCTAISRAIIEYFKANADIALDSADIQVSAGTFMDSLSAPITGKGITDPVTLSGKIE